MGEYHQVQQIYKGTALFLDSLYKVEEERIRKNTVKTHIGGQR